MGRTAFSRERAWDMADALDCSLDEHGGRKWPLGGSPTLSADERDLVNPQRKMDAPNKEQYKGLAGMFIVASEKDGPGTLGDVNRPVEPVREELQVGEYRNHRALAKKVLGYDGRWMVTYDEVEVVDELYKPTDDWQIAVGEIEVGCSAAKDRKTVCERLVLGPGMKPV